MDHARSRLPEVKDGYRKPFAASRAEPCTPDFGGVSCSRCGLRTWPMDRFTCGICIMAGAVKRLVICVDNSGYEVSLERRKIYVSLPDAKAENLGQSPIDDHGFIQLQVEGKWNTHRLWCDRWITPPAAL